MRLEPFLALRNVREFETRDALSYDGYLEPRGLSFADGFKIVVNKNAASSRLRFTIVHELCHSFFYELVPEMKYSSRCADDQEEALCNVGAAAFLMPARGLKQRVDSQGISIQILEQLAEEYAVSVQAVCLRLRRLRIWKGQLSVWGHLPDGRFRLENVYGGIEHDWRWIDESIPRAAWESGGMSEGQTFLYHRNEAGINGFKPLSYQISRRGDKLMVLSGAVHKCRSVPPLFSEPSGQPVQGVLNLGVKARSR